MDLQELINLFESSYTNEQQKEISEYLWKAKRNSHIPDSPLLFDLIDKGFLKICEKKYIEYRLRKYFTAHNIEKISDKKDFIFNQLPNLKGLPRGKNTSYDDTIEFISKNYYELFDKVLSDFKTYDFGYVVENNGENLTKYVYRKFNLKSNYMYNQETKKYELKDDEITQLLLANGSNIKVDNPEELFTNTIRIDISDTLNNGFKKMLATYEQQNQNQTIKKFLKVSLMFFLCVTCFPLALIVGIGYLYLKSKK